MTTDSPHAAPPVSLRQRTLPQVRGFFQGLAAPFHGLKFLLTHRSLLPYALVPFLINAAVTLFLLALFLTSAAGIIYWMHGLPYFATSAWTRTQEVFLSLFIVASLIGCTAAVYILLGGILSAYFNERLARQVEILLGTPAAELQEAPLKQQAIDGLRGFLTVAATSLVCLLLGCIPLLNLAGAVISFYVSWFVFGYEFFEMPLSLRGARRKTRRAFARQHRSKVLGLGATVYCLGLIPILGSIFLTTAAVGSVLLNRTLPPPDADEATPTAASS